MTSIERTAAVEETHDIAPRLAIAKLGRFKESIMPNYECRTVLYGDTDMNYLKLSDKQLLALLIGEKNAEQLYTGTLAPLFLPAHAKRKEYYKLTAARELVRRFLAEELIRGPIFVQTESVREYLKVLFAGQEHESFVVLFVDSRNRLITAEELFRGTINGTAVYPREIVKRALRVNASAVIFAHNHPSGVAEPSRQDEVLTEKLKEALAIVDIRVLDHLVVAENTTVSFAERGLL